MEIKNTAYQERHSADPSTRRTHGNLKVCRRKKLEFSPYIAALTVILSVFLVVNEDTFGNSQ